MEKPLAIVTTYNRFDETRQCLTSFEPYFADLQLIVVDNGSTEEMTDWLRAYAKLHAEITVLLMAQNHGCPRALNEALQFRKPGQPVIKIDNDVVLLNRESSWITDIEALVEGLRLLGNPVAMVSAYYEPWNMSRVVGVRNTWLGEKLLSVRPVIGHCVYHTGEFMDTVGYFDVLAQDHLYGFEDLLLSHKATALNLAMVAWGGWRIENIQRHGAIGSREVRNEHVEKMRPLYNARAALVSPKRVYTDINGELL